jgi:signal peptide peptidase SppA
VTEPNQPRGRDRQIIRFVTESAWAIRKSNLVAICDLIARHSTGIDATAEQIAEALAANAARPRTPAPRGGSVAVIPLRGAIVPHADVMTEMSGGTSVDGFLEQLNAALDDDQVGHIVLDIDSPGGAVDRIPEAAAQIRAGRAKKPITAIANTTAASAAYWLAAQASELVVTPSGQVGSIGVYAAHDDISGMQEKMGVVTTLVSAGDHKTDESPFEPLSDEARASIQARVDGYYRMFVADVAKGRGVSAGEVEASYGQGGMLLAADALRAGMVDRVATVEDTIRAALGSAPGRTRARAELEQATHAELVQAGFEADSVLDAIDANDMTALVHTGLVSVS